MAQGIPAAQSGHLAQGERTAAGAAEGGTMGDSNGEATRAVPVDGEGRELLPEMARGGASVVARTPAVAAAMARAQSEVQSRYVIARANPRNWDDIRTRLLKECRRPGFARVARYHVPRGEKGIEGLSIRFAEAAIRIAGNIALDVEVVHESADYRQIRAVATDLETNASFASVSVIEKTTERRKVREGQEVLGERMNSSGAAVFLVRADEGEMFMKTNKEVSKAFRSALRLIPGDIVEECDRMCRLTLRNEDAADPLAARRLMLDAFAEENVIPSEIEAFLGHALDRMTDDERDQLRGIYVALKEGTITWDAVLAAKRDTGKAPEPARRFTPKAGPEGRRPDAPAEPGAGQPTPAVVDRPASVGAAPVTRPAAPAPAPTREFATVAEEAARREAADPSACEECGDVPADGKRMELDGRN